MKRAVKQAILLFCRGIGLFYLARQLSRRELRILCYHGFSMDDEHEFSATLFITKERFRRRLAYLSQRKYSILPLGDALEKLQAGTLPPASVVITIDDGFHGIQQVAHPLLAEYSCPATVYLTTYYSTRPHPVFRLAVRYMFWKTSRDEMDVTGLHPDLHGKRSLGNAASTDALMWKIIDHGEQQLNEDERVALARQIGERLGVDFDGICKSRILTLLSPAEVHALARAGIDFQLHTHRHDFPEDRAGALRELRDNRAVLTPLAQRPLVHFCYPSGKYSRRHLPILEEAGVESAVTCERDLNDRHTHRLLLRRLLDSESISSVAFEGEVSGFLPLTRRWVAWLRGSAPHG